MELYICRKEIAKENKVCFTIMYKPSPKRMTYKTAITIYINNIYETMHCSNRFTKHYRMEF